MVSPWRLLSRWVSRRRQSEPEEGPSDVGRDEALALPPPAEAQGHSTRLSTNGVERPSDQSNASAAKTQRKLNAQDSAHPNANVEDSLHPVEATNPVVTGDVETRGQRAAMPARLARGKRLGTARKRPEADGEEINAQAAQVTSASSSHLDLDHEIKMLREQLAIKLQLQNEQLKKMLERFDR